MNIALCDDDGRFRAQTARSLADILEKRGMKAEVDRFRDAEELLAATEAGRAYDVFLLDIVMPGMDGVTLARRLRAAFATVPILFFTTSSDFAVEAFALGATHYVVKPFTREEFEQAIDRALALVPRSKATDIVLKTSDGLVKVPFDELVYSETDEHYQRVQMADGRKVFSRMSGQELWRAVETSGRFVRAGMKYIINVSKIVAIDKTTVRLSGGHALDVPRRSAADVKAAYLRFCCG